jgi:glutamate---cysteine ligase / carboxylate-amine ligase
MSHSHSRSLHLFEAFGVELEYMIVDTRTLQVKPIADELIRAEAGAYVSDVERGTLAWSNELVLHVVELKTNGPAPDLGRLAAMFQQEVSRINAILARHDAMLLPSGMHPLMDPATDTRLWPHDYNVVYETYNRIFNCQGHGWSNLQSTHLNLPFADDEEFARLHAAIRLLLPILPALSASSPLVEGRYSGFCDTRLEVYRQNQARIPAIAGSVIPEAVFSQADYQAQILDRAYRDIAPYDPEGVLQDEFLNSRGAIARFSRGAIEIRLLDIQECPQADLALLQVVVAVLQQLVAERWASFKNQKTWHHEELAEIFLEVIQHGMDTLITNAAFLHLFGISQTICTARGLWQHLWQEVRENQPLAPEVAAVMEVLLGQGNLSERITAALGSDPDASAIVRVYRRLSDCLAAGTLFRPEG